MHDWEEQSKNPFLCRLPEETWVPEWKNARALYMLTATLEESRWENSLDGGFPPTTTYTEPEGRSKGCQEVKLERSMRKSAFAQLVG